ncbi:MAG TPA: septum formation inhibitor Maf [Rhodocyclaceae bacterium]|nr:MAG: septum formation protein Maf [Betaproteobacteria bacterium CG2_30_68_42]PIV73330.1 MAG: septum formation inhibitor Maf [Rhodocyclales bacterium CG17_big_fil_post_rev_8_21_14_2_50_68_7]PIX74364.1 MAG: septum formation inhibitor Maf [Rhodocyclales bacterium CG_4_10_14_3_um_filter_68_10]PJA56619.1 MAG: septum formation inhibitor Maf [Rhodocyclales bacterium CG_4_9_14_3_um_filter_68_10]HCX32086.1 septum formation inhibitor Maf [Rhodocyclaceae bacterium]
MNTLLRIYLASRSPRRRELLRQLHVNLELLLFRGAPREDIEVSETILPGESAQEYTLRLARAKAWFGARLIPMRRLHAQAVLAADTAVELDGAILGKPGGSGEAEAMLARLSGRAHRVLTAVALAEGDRLEHALSVSEVRFRSLGSEEIRRYVAAGESADKAGAYAIQGRAAGFIAEIRGSYSGIMGLPLFETAELLRGFGHSWL